MYAWTSSRKHLAWQILHEDNSLSSEEVLSQNTIRPPKASYTNSGITLEISHVVVSLLEKNIVTIEWRTWGPGKQFSINVKAFSFDRC